MKFRIIIAFIFVSGTSLANQQQDSNNLIPYLTGYATGVINQAIVIGVHQTVLNLFLKKTENLFPGAVQSIFLKQLLLNINTLLLWPTEYLGRYLNAFWVHQLQKEDNPASNAMFLNGQRTGSWHLYLSYLGVHLVSQLNQQVSNPAESSSELPGESCTICHNAMSSNQVSLPCKHCYHRPCILGWMAIQQTCPLCRKRFMQIEITQFLRLQPQTIADIPTYVSSLLETLDSQQKFTGRGSYVEDSKILLLSDWSDRKMVDILGCLAYKQRKDAWLVDSFGGGNDVRYDSHGHQLGEGIELSEYDFHRRCSLEEMHNVFRATIKRSQHGWKKASPTDYPDILHKPSDTEWFLYIKEDPFSMEDDLIQCLAYKFDLNKSMRCSNDWQGGPRWGNTPVKDGQRFVRKSSFLWVIEDTCDKSQKIMQFFGLFKPPVLGYKAPAYLWIKKEDFRAVQAVMQFEIDGDQTDL